MNAPKWSTFRTSHPPVVWKRTRAGLLALPLLYAGTGCVSDFATPTPGGAIVASVVIMPTGPDTLTAIGAQKEFTAQARDANGAPISGKTFTWSSDAPNVVAIDSVTGIATVLGNGVATIRASADGFAATDVLVARQVVSVVAVAPASFALGILESRELVATARDANGNAVSRVVAFSWSSSDPLAVSVGPGADASRATVTRSLPGAATITATAENQSGSATAN